jgi:hypothetical protein
VKKVKSIFFLAGQERSKNEKSRYENHRKNFNSLTKGMVWRYIENPSIITEEVLES